jgi:hypothetical protein
MMYTSGFDITYGVAAAAAGPPAAPDPCPYDFCIKVTGDGVGVPLVPFSSGTCLFALANPCGPRSAANNPQSRLQQIANHLKNCGGVYPLVAASAGNFNIGSVPGAYAVTSPSDNASNGFNGGNSTTTIDASNFVNADPVTQTGVVVHEWFHQMQINNSYVFRFKVFFNRQGVEAEANAAAKEAIQKCGPG